MRAFVDRRLPLLLLLISGFGCVRQHPAYVPELGGLMLLQQARHTKIWLAGQAGNWPLADYELQELSEGFDTVVTYHPTDPDSPVAPKDVIPRMVTVPLEELRDAVRRKDEKLFAERYDALTAACNNCHQATNVGFNHVQRPETNPFPNQVFPPIGNTDVAAAR